MSNYFYIHKINRVIDYIEDNIGRRLTLNKLAKVAEFSEYHFHRIFKLIIGETLNAYIKRIRMGKIYRQIVLEKNKSVTDIAFDFGYNSSANLSRDYNNFYGITPSQARIQNLKPNPGQYDSNIRLNLKFIGIKYLSDKQVIYFRVANGYFPGLIRQAFRKISEYSEKNHDLVKDENLIGIAYDDPDFTPLNKCRYDACFPVRENTRFFHDAICNKRVIKGGKYAMFLFEGKSENFHSAWKIIFKKWVIKNQYIPDNKPHIEEYLAADRLKNFFKANLYLPVKKK